MARVPALSAPILGDDGEEVLVPRRSASGDVVPSTDAPSSPASRWVARPASITLVVRLPKGFAERSAKVTQSLGLTCDEVVDALLHHHTPPPISSPSGAWRLAVPANAALTPRIKALIAWYPFLDPKSPIIQYRALYKRVGCFVLRWDSTPRKRQHSDAKIGATATRTEAAEAHVSPTNGTARDMSSAMRRWASKRPTDARSEGRPSPGMARPLAGRARLRKLIHDRQRGDTGGAPMVSHLSPPLPGGDKRRSDSAPPRALGAALSRAQQRMRHDGRSHGSADGSGSSSRSAGASPLVSPSASPSSSRHHGNGGGGGDGDGANGRTRVRFKFPAHYPTAYEWIALDPTWTVEQAVNKAFGAVVRQHQVRDAWSHRLRLKVATPVKDVADKAHLARFQATKSFPFIPQHVSVRKVLPLAKELPCLELCYSGTCVAAIKCGWLLLRLSGTSEWNRRWCVLQRHVLQWYAEPPEPGADDASAGSAVMGRVCTTGASLAKMRDRQRGVTIAKLIPPHSEAKDGFISVPVYVDLEDGQRHEKHVTAWLALLQHVTQSANDTERRRGTVAMPQLAPRSASGREPVRLQSPAADRRPARVRRRDAAAEGDGSGDGDGAGGGGISKDTKLMLARQTVQLSHVLSHEDPSQLYTDFRKIGSGGFSNVWKAIDVETGRRVVVKMARVSDKNFKYVMGEICNHKRFDHPNIVRFSKAYVVPHSKEVWMIMEYMAYGPLLLYLKADWDEPQMALLLREALQGLAAMHAANRIHRDIKPGNILIADPRTIKLGDFGFSVRMEDPCDRPKSLVGTPLWMAPEMVLRGGYGCEVDVWALGIVAIQLAQGGTPPGRGMTPRDMMKQRLSEGVHLEHPDQWSSKFVDFVEAALVVAPEQRATAEQLLQHPWLECAAESLSIVAHKRSAQRKREAHLLKEMQRNGDLVVGAKHVAGLDG